MATKLHSDAEALLLLCGFEHEKGSNMWVLHNEKGRVSVKLRRGRFIADFWPSVEVELSAECGEEGLKRIEQPISMSNELMPTFEDLVKRNHPALKSKRCPSLIGGELSVVLFNYPLDRLGKVLGLLQGAIGKLICDRGAVR